MRSESSWSFISPVPFNLYVPECDGHLTYWNGIAMTRTYALMIYGLVWMSIYPTESQKKEAWKEYIRIYKSNGFLTQAWDNILISTSYQTFHNHLIRYINSKDQDFFVKLKNKYTPNEALLWFLPSKEIESKNENRKEKQ